MSSKCTSAVTDLVILETTKRQPESRSRRFPCCPLVSGMVQETQNDTRKYSRVRVSMSTDSDFVIELESSIGRSYLVFKHPRHHPRNARKSQRRSQSHGECHRVRKRLNTKHEPLITCSLQASQASSKKCKEIQEKTPESRYVSLSWELLS